MYIFILTCLISLIKIKFTGSVLQYNNIIYLAIKQYKNQQYKKSAYNKKFKW